MRFDPLRPQLEIPPGGPRKPEEWSSVVPFLVLALLAAWALILVLLAT